jgi:hypothetical protein
MRILQAENIAPIHLQAGDGIQLTYREVRKPSTFARMFGERDEVTEHVLATETFNEPRVVDRIAVVELENGELGALGMSQGIAGVFGRQA